MQGKPLGVPDDPSVDKVRGDRYQRQFGIALHARRAFVKNTENPADNL
jgi:hypothetical protein